MGGAAGGRAGSRGSRGHGGEGCAGGAHGGAEGWRRALRQAASAPRSVPMVAHRAAETQRNRQEGTAGAYAMVSMTGRCLSASHDNMPENQIWHAQHDGALVKTRAETVILV